jgi:hypothetical protein
LRSTEYSKPAVEAKRPEGTEAASHAETRMWLGALDQAGQPERMGISPYFSSCAATRMR